MTFHTNRHDVIETDDITDVQHVHIAHEDGKPVAFIKAFLDPRKDYQALKDCFVFLTNGINHRMLGPFEHAQPAIAPVASAESQGEATQPLTDTTTASPSTPKQEAKGSTDNSVSADTVELPAVTPPSKGKGN